MTLHHIHTDDNISLCGYNDSGDTHAENCSDWHDECKLCLEKAILLELCYECLHPKSDHPPEYGSSACIHDLDADYDYEAERYVKCGGCDCPEFIKIED